MRRSTRGRWACLRHAIVLIAVVASTARGQRVDIDWSAFEAAVRADMAQRGIPGVVIVVANARRPVYSQAFGVANAATGEALTTAHRLQLGSVTKTFTALLALQLAARGDVDLGAPVGDRLSGLPPALARLTLRDLLRHHAGLRDVAGDDGPDDEAALAEWSRALADTMRLLPPGVAFSYSNAGYALAGAVLQAAGRRPFADLLRATVLAPMGMGGATMRPNEAQRGPTASGHEGTPGPPATPSAGPPVNNTQLWPAGYAWASGDDLGPFLVTLLAKGVLRGSPGLYRGVVDSALSPAVDVPGLLGNARYGMGAFIDRAGGLTRAWHPGSVRGFSALWRIIPDEHIGVAILANRDGVRLDALADSALATALAVLPNSPGGGERRTADRPAAQAGRGGDPRAGGRAAGGGRGGGGANEGMPLTREEARLLEGRYEGRFPLELVWRDGVLYLVRGGASFPVRSYGANRYAIRPPGAERPEPFRFRPGTADLPPIIEMSLWAFVRQP